MEISVAYNRYVSEALEAANLHAHTHDRLLEPTVDFRVSYRIFCQGDIPEGGLGARPQTLKGICTIKRLSLPFFNYKIYSFEVSFNAISAKF